MAGTLAHLRSSLLGSWNALLDFIYPPLCFHCNALIVHPERGLCAACTAALVRLDEDHTTWIETASRLRANGCVDDLISCYLFEKNGGLQELIHALKYQHMQSIGRFLGRELGNRLAAKPACHAADGLIPVPLHPTKLRERGYNQSVLICDGISSVSGIRIESDLLRRVRYTETQTALRLDQRRRNVSGAFALRKGGRSGVQGKRFILVDDVITTGATVCECALELRNNGAAGITAASIALAQ